MNFRLYALVALLVAIPVSFTASAYELRDGEFGFAVEIPGDWKQLDPDPEDPDLLYHFLAAKDATEGMELRIQRTHALQRQDARASEADIAEASAQGISMSTTAFPWRGIELEMTRITGTDSEESEIPEGVVAFEVTYPLDGEAVQMVGIGSVQDEEAVASLFTTVASGFRNTRALYTPKPKLVEKELTTEDRIGGVIGGVARFAVFLTVVLWLTRLIIRKLSGVRGKFRRGNEVPASTEGESDRPPGAPGA